MAMVGDNVGSKKWMVMINRKGAGNNQEIATCFSKRSRTSDGVRVRDSSREKGKTAERWAMVARRVW